MCPYLETGPLQGELWLNGATWPGPNRGCVLMRSHASNRGRTIEDRARKQLSAGRRTTPQERPSSALGACRAVRKHAPCSGRQVPAAQPSPTSRCSSARLTACAGHAHRLSPGSSPSAGSCAWGEQGLGSMSVCHTERDVVLSLRLHCS